MYMYCTVRHMLIITIFILENSQINFKDILYIYIYIYIYIHDFQICYNTGITPLLLLALSNIVFIKHNFYSICHSDYDTRQQTFYFHQVPLAGQIFSRRRFHNGIEDITRSWRAKVMVRKIWILSSSGEDNTLRMTAKRMSNI